MAKLIISTTSVFSLLDSAMCDAIRIGLSEFSQKQIEQHQLTEYVTGNSQVIFRQNIKPYLIPFLLNGRVKLTHWARHCHESLLTEGTIHQAEPKLIEIPATMAYQSGVWFKVDPLRIRGILVPRDKTSSQIHILTKPASVEYEMMTHSEWEPVCNRQPNYFRL